MSDSLGIAYLYSDSPEWFKMMDFWQLTGLSNDQISQKFLKSIDEEIKQLKENDLEKYGEEKNPVTTHEKVCKSIKAKAYRNTCHNYIVGFLLYFQTDFKSL